MEKNKIEHYCDDCDYGIVSYCEYDTGYKELKCSLVNGECCGFCPFDCEYEMLCEQNQ